MITTKGKTDREVFEELVSKLVAQGGQCLESDGACAYGDGKGNHCRARMKTIEHTDEDTVIIDGVTYARVEPQDEEPKPWPQEDDVCFLLGDDGVILNSGYKPWSYHRKWLEQGNLFATRAEAEAERDRRAAEHRVLTRLRELSGDWVADWGDIEQGKFYPVMSHPNGSVRVYYTTLTQEAPARYYGPQEAWQQIIDEMLDDVKRMLG